MEKILIVGANGYFGSTLLKFLNYKKVYCEGVDINYFKKCNILKKNEKVLNICASRLTESYLKKLLL